MDGKDAPQIFQHLTTQLNLTPYDVKWLPFSSKCVMLGQTPKMTGKLNFYRLEKDGLKLILQKDFPKGLKTSSFNFYNSKDLFSLAIGDTGGNLFIFDMEKQKVSWEIQKAHNGIINSIDSIGGILGKGQIEIVSGGRDGKVKLWDPRQTKPVLILAPKSDQNIKEENQNVLPDCWSVAFGNCFDNLNRNIVSGYDNGDLKMFDLKTNKLIWDTNLKNGICGLEFDRKDIKMNKLAVCTLEGRVHIFNLRTYNTEIGYTDLQQKLGGQTIWGVRHFPQNRDLLSTMGGDGELKIFKYINPSQPFIEDADGNKKGLVGELQSLNDQQIADQPIVGLDWNQDKLGLGISSSLDQKIVVLIVTKLNHY